MVIYQVLCRLFGPGCSQKVLDGTLAENGCGKLNDISPKALLELKDLGITDIWLTGIIRHASSTAYSDIGIEASNRDLLKGKAGSPYAIKDYFDINPDLAVDPSHRMEEFKNLIKRAKEFDMGIFIDFVPNHVSRDYMSICLPPGLNDLGHRDRVDLKFDRNNNFYYLPGSELILPIEASENPNIQTFIEKPARVTGNDVFHNCPATNDWYETIKLNYGVDYENNQNHFTPLPDTWIKMLQILNYWAEKGIKGFRCDMAGMVPHEFWNYAISALKRDFPEIIFIAEIYEPDKYEIYLESGFDYLYDKVGLYDCSKAIINGSESTESISRLWHSLNGREGQLLRFLENHDEQRIASQYFAGDPWKALPGMALAALMNTGPVLIYFGQELGEKAEGSSGFSGNDGRTSIFDYTSVPSIMDWINDGKYDGEKLSSVKKELRSAYQTLLKILENHSVFSEGHFYDLMWLNGDLPNSHQGKVFAFLRYKGSDYYIVVVNFSDSPGTIRIRIPEHPLEAMGISDQFRFTVDSIYPYPNKEVILMTQLVNSGINIEFDKTGWALKKLSF